MRPQRDTYMRILLLIVMVLAIVVSAGMGVMIGYNNLFEADAQTKITEAEEQVAALAEAPNGKENPMVAKASEALSALKGYKWSGWGGIVVGSLSALMLIIGFTRLNGTIAAVGVAIIVCGLAFIALSPGVTVGDAATPRLQAMVYGIAGVVAAAAAMGASKVRIKREMDAIMA